MERWHVTYEDIVASVRDGVATLAINRPENANKLRFQTARELHTALREIREDPAVDVAILTGTGDKFFCIGGEHEQLSSLDYSSVMPVIDLYELIDTMPKPVIAAVNGFAVGGGNVLQVVCDLSVAAPHAVFRISTAKMNCNPSPHSTVRQGNNLRCEENPQAMATNTTSPSRLMSLSCMG